MANLPRFNLPTEASNLAAAASFINSIPGAAAADVDALVIWPGLEKYCTLKHGAALWNKGVGKRLLVAGQHEEDFAKNTLAPEKFQALFGVTREGQLISQGHTPNTKTQCEWVATMVEEHNIESIALLVPAFHLVRAYLTLLQALKKRRGLRVPVIPLATPMSPNKVIPLPNGTQWDLFPAEIARVPVYQEKGDVLGFGDLASYLDWLFQQPVLQPYVVS